MKKIFVALMILIGTVSGAFAQTSFFPVRDSTGRFELSLPRDPLILGAGVLVYGTDLILDKGFDLNHQEWKGVLDKSQINSLDALAVNSYSDTLHNAGTVGMVAGMCLPAITLATACENWKDAAVYATMYGEALLLAQGTKEIIKLAVNRPRPYSYSDGAPLKHLEDGDWANSFPSGHSTLAFTGASFTIFTFAVTHPGSLWNIPVSIGCSAVALGTAALRVASGNHFITDVTAGAAIGTLFGVGVPLLHMVWGNDSALLKEDHSVSGSKLSLNGNGASVRIWW